ncbi:MAG: hypothetical protein HWD92_01590 [Flavobacteriia bacterium]|nr:hypothetical protein [Flavobacteriia bacterium]
MLKNSLIVLLAFFILTACQKDDGMNTGKSETTIRIVSLPGISPFPDGAQFEAYAYSGPLANRTYSLLDLVELSPSDSDPYVLEGKLTYEGVHPVSIELRETEEPQVDLPLEFSNPFYSQNVDFDAKLGLNEYEVYYYPNFWVNLQVYTVRSPQEIGASTFLLGNGRTSLVIGSVNLNNREFLGDTLESTGMGYLSPGTSAPLYLANASADNSDSLLVSLGFSDFVAHDTTFVFYDADQGIYSITY